MSKELRLKEAFEYLKSRGIVHKQKDVADIMQSPESNVSRAFKGDVKYLTEGFLRRFNESFNNLFNDDWLLTGEGEMLNGFNGNKAIEIECEEDYQTAIKAGLRLIPETSFTFAAGQTELVTQNETITRYWYLPDCKDCEGIASMQGNSMLPAYPPGCKLVLKRFSYDSDNPNSIPFGSVFGIVVEDKVTGDYHGHIKILRRYRDFEMSKKYWIAHSVNSEFDDFDIEIAQVRSLWIVKQHIVSDIIL